MSSENRRASLRSRMNVAGKDTVGTTSKRTSPKTAAASPLNKRGGGGRRGRPNKSQPKINDSLKATRRGGGRKSTELKTKANKLKEEEQDNSPVEIHSIGEEEEEDSGSLKVNLGTGQCVESGNSSSISRGNKSAKEIETEGHKLYKELTKEDELMLLKEFDLNGTYGACRGITRMERFQRALKYSLQPPPLPLVADILLQHPDNFEYSSCIWDQNDLLRVRK